MAVSKLAWMFSPDDAQKRVCEKHGDFKAFKFNTPQKPMWSGCPRCHREAVKQEDRELAREAWQNKIEAFIGRAAIPDRFTNASLNTYMAECDGQKRALAAAHKYVSNWDSCLTEGTSLIMCGNPGTGKTHLAIGIIKKVIEKGGDALFARMIDVAASVKETYGGGPKTERQIYKEYAAPDLLVVDEIGHGYGSDTERMVLFEVINRRYEKAKPTIIITNLSLAGLRDYLDERAEDRLREGAGRVIVFDWKSWRK